jgi:hypothetical protein
MATSVVSATFVKWKYKAPSHSFGHVAIDAHAFTLIPVITPSFSGDLLSFLQEKKVMKISSIVIAILTNIFLTMTTKNSGPLH